MILAVIMITRSREIYLQAILVDCLLMAAQPAARTDLLPLHLTSSLIPSTDREGNASIIEIDAFPERHIA